MIAPRDCVIRAVLLSLPWIAFSFPTELLTRREFKGAIGVIAQDSSAAAVSAAVVAVSFVHVADSDLALTTTVQTPPSNKTSLTPRSIGAENRELFKDTAYPYSAMGKIVRSDGTYCTGSLVGPKHVACASHCVAWSNSSIGLRFLPDYYDGEVYPSADVTTVIYQLKLSASDYFTECEMKDDWAIFILNARLGDTQGWLGAKTIDSTLFNKTIFRNFGYPYDLGVGNGQETYRQSNITVFETWCDAYGPLGTNTDASGGQSGGPLWLPADSKGEIYQYGTCSSGDDRTRTIFASGDRWQHAIAYARKNWP